MHNVRDYGALGDGAHKDTVAIQKAIDACAEQGGTVLFPAGRYLTGTLNLRSNVTLHLEAGCFLLGSTDQYDYPVLRPELCRNLRLSSFRSLLYGEKLERVAIAGRGVVDGQGGGWDGKKMSAQERPHAILLVGCRHVAVTDVHLRNSGSWLQHYLLCEDLVVRGITAWNHCNYNNDMIDIDSCRDVRISDCKSDTDDDGITLKSITNLPCENVAITNCVVSSHCTAIKCGTESAGGFKNVAVSNCVVSSSARKEKFYGCPEGNCGITLIITDGGTLDNMTISNIVIQGAKTPIYMRLGNRARQEALDAPPPQIGVFRNVMISNVVASGAKRASFIDGLPGHPIEDVTLANLRLGHLGGGTPEDAAVVIPQEPQAYPDSHRNEVLPVYGFFARNVDGLRLRNIQFALDAQDARAAYVLHEVTRCTMEDIEVAESV